MNRLNYGFYIFTVFLVGFLMFLRFLFGWFFSGAMPFWPRSAPGRAFPVARKLPWECDRRPAAVGSPREYPGGATRPGNASPPLGGMASPGLTHRAATARATRSRGGGPAAAPPLQPWKSAPAPARPGARGGEPQPLLSDSSSGLPASGPVTPSGGQGWDGTGRAGMGAGEGTAEPAGGFKCRPGRRRQHSRAARSGCRGHEHEHEHRGAGVGLPPCPTEPARSPSAAPARRPGCPAAPARRQAGGAPQARAPEVSERQRGWKRRAAFLPPRCLSRCPALLEPTF